MSDDYCFTTEWFVPHAGTWWQHLASISGKPELRFLEIGCFEGRATVWLLQSVLNDETSRIDCIDTFMGSSEHEAMGIDVSDIELRFDHNLRVSGVAHKVTKLKGYSHDILRRRQYDLYDFIYVDGSHTATDVLEDAVQSHRLLKRGGILIFDDYEWNWFADEYLMPKIAIDAFLGVFVRDYELLHRGYQVILRKA